MLKSEAITQAFQQIRISGLTTVAVPEETNIALIEMDQMAWAWRQLQRNVNYNFPPATADQTRVRSDPNETLGVYDWAQTGFIASLAGMLCEYYGKDVPPPLRRKIRIGMLPIKSTCLQAIPEQYPNRMPIGSGQRRGTGFRRTYHPRYRGRGPTTPLAPTQILDRTVDFSNDFETLDSYTIEVLPNSGLKLLSDSQDGNVVQFRVEAVADDGVYSDGSVSVTGTSDTGVVLPQVLKFNVTNNQYVITSA